VARLLLIAAMAAMLPGFRAVADEISSEEDNAATGPWTLRYQFEDGETLYMQVRHRAVSDTTIAGTTQSVETSTETPFS